MVSSKKLLRHYGWVVITICFLIKSCHLIPRDIQFISSIDYSVDKENEVILFSKTYDYTDTKKLRIHTNRIIRLGENSRTFKYFFSVWDGSVMKLTNFSGKIVHRNGKTKKYYFEDLLFVNLSSSSKITEEGLRAVSILEPLAPGDFILEEYTYETEFEEFGLSFELSDIGLKAENIEVKVITPLNSTIQYKIVNDYFIPEQLKDEKSLGYIFKWKEYKPELRRCVYKKKNYSKGLLAQVVKENRTSNVNNWQQFGNWYRKLIEDKLTLSNEIIAFTDSLCQGLADKKDKVDRIYDYCQREIRYEQVYLSNGEFIPHSAEEIFRSKYGDCKDYSTLIYTMAKSVGVEMQLALCYRGRGYEFYSDIPVNQFNHMIAHLEYEGKHYWYDGTNRRGFAGMTTIDLINTPALVLSNNSYLDNIEECVDNRLKISGDFQLSENNLIGELRIELFQQYAIDFLSSSIFLNKQDMIDHISAWIKLYITETMTFKSVSWEKGENSFVIRLKVKIPNALLKIDDYYYTSLGKILPDLMPKDALPDNKEDLFYYPYYNRVEAEFRLKEFIPEKISFTLDFPPGPYKSNTNDSFRNEYLSAKKLLENKYKLMRSN